MAHYRNISANAVFFNAQSGGAGPKCGCGSWKNHWKKYAGASANFQCLNKRCKKRQNRDWKKRKIIISSFDGSHIVLRRSSPHQYIVPLCDTCNRSRHKLGMRAIRSVKAVLASKGELCGESRDKKLRRKFKRQMKKISPP